ncbi:MAG: excinuclease ABC subunit UvrA [Bacteroidales bacterium]|nr:excinuclease ABC subunit UvrA [Bacteroidales bacterium]
MSANIVVKGARVNNLKNIDLELPGNKFIVITGLSGSGKSSLAFDTLYAEGQRRYVESLSAYARQFMGKLSKPECDWIKGLPPAIAIEQKVNTRNPRSTVGTSTEIYDYLRLLFSRVGRTYSPISGEQVKKHTAEDVIECATSYPDGTRLALVAPISLPQGRTLAQQLDIYIKEGFSRLVKWTRAKGKAPKAEFVPIDELLAQPKLPVTPEGYDLLIDRFAASHEQDEVSRLSESVETAFFEGHDQCSLVVWDADGTARRHDFSKRFEADGITFLEPSDQLFNFNNPYGACPTCEGFGKIIGIDEKLVVPNPALSVFDDAVVCWRGEKMSEWKRELIHLAPHISFPIHRPYCDLTEAEKRLLWEGNSRFKGINGFFKWVERQQAKIQYRVMLARFRGKTTCPDCHGARLRPEAEYVKVAGRSITELVRMPVSELQQWFAKLELDPTDAAIAKRILTEINNRLGFLMQVGLGYLTLDRLSNSLSGGESQRINLATSLGSSLVGSLYILDEPSIGLHPRDTQKLIGVLRDLQQIGNTVVVVEHDEEIMRAADWIVDVGPKAGRLGGQIVYEGPVPADDDKALVEQHPDSYTLKYLANQLEIPTPKQRRHWSSFIEVKGAREHNLKNVDVKFPLGVMTVVTGVSGSGKSTLVRDVLYRAMRRRLGEAGEAPGAHLGLEGDLHRITAVEFVDQNPIGTSSRSNPATYLKAYDEIRKLFADQQAAKQMGFTAAYFSTNTDGGRCDECKGAGVINIEMQFMADISIPCEACHGKRFKPDILEVRYRGQNIDDVLNMTVNQAIEFFGEDGDSQAKKIVKRLLPLQQVGLGYIKLGQTSSTLSGGENQRVKLAYFLSQEKPQPAMLIFDEPTTGLHFHDISVLMASFDRLISQGHTIVIIEHNLEVIKCADHVIDIGPEGGDAGGYIVAQGTPEQIAACEESYTGRWLNL